MNNRPTNAVTQANGHISVKPAANGLLSEGMFVPIG
jgi:hypothetical protein